MPATSEKIRYWIDMTLECVRRDHTSPKFGSGDQKGPFLTARALGMALAALHDAYVDPSDRLIFDKGVVLPAGFSREISGCAACQHFLKLRYPQQAVGLNAAWDFWGDLHQIGVDLVSEDYGRRIAGQIDLLGIDDRQFGGAGPYKGKGPYVPAGDYTHQVDPNEPGQGFSGALWGGVKTIISGSVNNFAPPPGRNVGGGFKPNDDFSADFKKVQNKGSDQKRGRSGQEEMIGIFWGYDGASELGTPPRLYMQVVLQILDEIDARAPDKLTVLDELKIVAAIGLAMADAGVEAWRYKYSPDHMMWRPVHGIRHGLGGGLAPAEVGWNPLGKPVTNDPNAAVKSRESLTPNFPAYPSGHATFGAAAFQLLRVFLVEKGAATFDREGVDSLKFCAHSDEFNGRNFDQNSRDVPRSKVVWRYESIWKAITDNSVSRVYLGVHWQFDGVTVVSNEFGPGDSLGVFGIPGSPAQLGRRGGVWLGCQIANAIARKINIADAVINASGIPLPAPVAVGSP